MAEPTEFPDLSPLITSLATSGEQQKNNRLYQVLYLLIKKLVTSQRITEENFDQIIPDLSALLNVTFITVDDETALLLNSRRAVAGTNITLNTSTPGQIIINASGAVTGFYDSPLTDGNVNETDIIFANGECVIVQVPNP
jgi:hypothetical protein